MRCTSAPPPSQPARHTTHPFVLPPHQAGLEAAPRGLPAALVAQPLFATQKVDCKGFGLAFGPVAGAPEGCGLVTSALRKKVTRKTMLPAMMHLISAGSGTISVQMHSDDHPPCPEY